MNPAEDVLSLPPFPPLKWNGHAWQGEIVLSAWAGFQSRRGPYDSQDSPEPSDGSATLSIRGPEVPDEEPRPPLPEQIAAFSRAIERQETVRDVILQAAFEQYPEWRGDFGSDVEGLDEWMPVLSSPDGLRALMGLGLMHVHHESHAGLAYVGYEFGCNWEGEHGLGVMMHGERVVEVGGADSAILEWIARRDAQAQAGG